MLLLFTSYTQFHSYSCFKTLSQCRFWVYSNFFLLLYPSLVTFLGIFQVNSTSIPKSPTFQPKSSIFKPFCGYKHFILIFYTQTRNKTSKKCPSNFISVYSQNHKPVQCQKRVDPATLFGYLYLIILLRFLLPPVPTQSAIHPAACHLPSREPLS